MKIEIQECLFRGSISSDLLKDSIASSYLPNPLNAVPLRFHKSGSCVFTRSACSKKERAS